VLVLGIDCSLRNCGLVLGELNLQTYELTVKEVFLVETEKESSKQIRQNSDDLKRARETQRAIKQWEKKVDVVFAEIPTGSQSNRGAMSNGITLGILASIEKPLIQLQPTEVKKLTVGSKTASKDDMIEWAVAKHPEIKWLKRTVKGKVELLNKNEHIADATAIIEAGVYTEEFTRLVQIMESIKRSQE
jgi:Holliday junction resolvasome RuvABC endonuclease subunit